MAARHGGANTAAVPVTHIRDAAECAAPSALLRDLDSLRALLSDDSDDGNASGGAITPKPNTKPHNNSNVPPPISRLDGNTERLQALAISAKSPVSPLDRGTVELFHVTPRRKQHQPPQRDDIAPHRNPFAKPATPTTTVDELESGRSRSRGRPAKKAKSRRQRTMSEPPTFRSHRAVHTKKAKKEELEAIRRRLFTVDAVAAQKSSLDKLKQSANARKHRRNRESPAAASRATSDTNSSVPPARQERVVPLVRKPRVDADNMPSAMAKKSSDMSPLGISKAFTKPAEAVADQQPTEVSVRDIERNGLKAMLSGKVPIAYFLFSVVQDMSSENLIFFLEVELYRRAQFASLATQMESAAHIVDTFLTSSSYFELNLDARTKKQTLERIQTAFSLSALDPKSDVERRECFADCKTAIIKTMEDSFRKFRTGPLYQAMKNDLGEGPEYTEAMRRKAATLLTTLLQPDSERVRILKPHIRKFCQSKLLLDFDDDTLNLKQLQQSNTDTKAGCIIKPTVITAPASKQRIRGGA